HLIEEVIVPVRTTDFTVGHDRHSYILLRLYSGNDRLIFGCPELLGSNGFFVEVALARVLYRLRTQQAADVIGAVRRACYMSRGGVDVGHSVLLQPYRHGLVLLWNFLAAR